MQQKQKHSNMGSGAARRGAAMVTKLHTAPTREIASFAHGQLRREAWLEKFGSMSSTIQGLCDLQSLRNSRGRFGVLNATAGVVMSRRNVQNLTSGSRVRMPCPPINKDSMRASA